MHVDHPVNQNLAHFVSDLFLVVCRIGFLQFGHEVNHILLVLVDGVFVRLNWRHYLFMTVQRTRSALGFDFIDDREFLINTHVLLDSLVEVGDVSTEEALVVLVVGLEFSQTGQLAVGLVVVDVHSK